jgi:hypothetical protein
MSGGQNPEHLPNRAPGQFTIKHGLYLDLEKFRIDGRSALGQAISKSRAALSELFPNGPDAAANALISRVVYKSLRCELFETWDMASGEASATSIQHYITLSNSLRNDLNALMSMADREKPPQAPDLHEYLAGLEKVNREE